MVSSLIGLVVPIVVVVLIVRAVAGRRSGEPVAPGVLVRRFFQYLLLYGMTLVVAGGVTTLGGLLGRRALLVDTSGDLARALTFLLIGTPLLVVLWRWTRRTMAEVPGESRSLGWLLYLALTALTGAVAALVSLQSLLEDAIGGRFEVAAAVQVLVWGALWGVHLRIESRTTEPEHRRVHHLLGAFIGWAVSLAGLVAVLSASLDVLLVPEGDVVVETVSTVGVAGALLLAGVPVWIMYWWLRERTAPATPLWYGYVLLAGVGISLVVTVTGASVALYRVLVWALGDLGGAATTSWGSGTLTALSVAVGGALSWWYHRQVLGTAVPAERSEVDRLHEYLLAAVALVAAAVGVVLVVVAFLEAVTPTASVLVDSSLINSVLAAATLLLVGGPLWWAFWRRIRSAVAADRDTEAASPTRRIYLYALFGLTGVVAVVALLVAVYGILEAALSGDLGADTVREQRVALGVLVAALALASYHWSVHREDRRLAPPPAAPQAVPTPQAVPGAPGMQAGASPVGPLESVLLIGPADERLVDEIRQVTSAHVELWVQESGRWDRQAVLAALAGARLRKVMLHADGEQMVQAGDAR
ncbi:DUF5671 domain-containing protein [Actinotalea sp.]|uniref:DUF5671 domain-containing protein n=1 Tax=Actinotalea sp. TaxID=1872145 RepID=UPI00356AC36C